MTDKRPPSRLSPKDIKIWKSVTHDVKRANNKDYLELDENSAPPSPQSSPRSNMPRPSQTHKPPRPINPAQPLQLDRRTDDRLRKGHIRPEATLDLHGMNQTQAHDALNNFIMRAHTHKKRCVLVITGKGEPRLSPKNRKDTAPTHWMDSKAGVLKRRVPDWLSTPPLTNYVLKYHFAQPKDGGTGALYVYLRKNN